MLPCPESQSPSASLENAAAKPLPNSYYSILIDAVDIRVDTPSGPRRRRRITVFGVSPRLVIRVVRLRHGVAVVGEEVEQQGPRVLHGAPAADHVGGGHPRDGAAALEAGEGLLRDEVLAGG